MILEAGTFRTIHSDLRQYNGQTVWILGETPHERFDPTEIGDDTPSMLVVMFPDGTEHDVYRDEVS